MDEMTNEEINRNVAALKGKPFQKPGHGNCCTCQVCGWDYDNCQCNYSTDIAAAWELVEEMLPTHAVNVMAHGKGWQCSCEIRDGTARYPVEIIHRGDVYANADTAPRAICLAYLAWKVRRG